MSASINDIRVARDEVVSGLDVTIKAVGDELAEYTTQDDYLARLSRRLQALTNERAEAYQRASESVLALPEVQASGARLTNLARQMNKAASVMKDTTKVLDKSTQVLTVAQQFVDTVAAAQKT